MSTTSTRQLTINSVSNIERMLSNAHYNCKVNLVNREVEFKGCDKFPMPDIAPEQSKVYFINSLIALKNYLNEFDLGDKVDTSTPF